MSSKWHLINFEYTTVLSEFGASAPFETSAANLTPTTKFHFSYTTTVYNKLN